MKKQTKNKRFIPLERINKEMFKRQFKYKRSVVSYLGVGLVGVGVVTLPLPTGSPLLIAFGLMLVSPLKLKDSWRNAKEDIRFKINKQLVLWGLK